MELCWSNAARNVGAVWLRSRRAAHHLRPTRSRATWIWRGSNGFNGLLTISNQIRSDPTNLPYSVDKRKMRGLTVYHLSWWRVLTEAIVQHRFRGIEDPDQAWILGELIRYLDDEKSGASGFEGMGQEWVRVRESARNDTLRASDPEAKAIAARWEQFVEYLCLHLSQELGVDVKHQRPRGKSPEERIGTVTKRLASDGMLGCSIRVPDAVGPFGVEVDLRTRRVTTTVEVPAPKEGQPQDSRQLAVAPVGRRVRRSPHRDELRERESDAIGVAAGLQGRPGETAHGGRSQERAATRLSWHRPSRWAKNAGASDGSFVAETRRQATDFYRDLVQGLMPPRTKAPKIREEEKPNDSDSQPKSTAEKNEGRARQEREASLRRLAEVMPFAPD